MLGLPTVTEVNRPLPKKAIYAKFGLRSAVKDRLDSDIAKIVIANEISPSRTLFQAGKTVTSIFVLSVTVKRKDFADKSIVTVSKLIQQHLVMLLNFQQEIKAAIYHTKLLQTAWIKESELILPFTGWTLDEVWENLVAAIGEIKVDTGHTLEEQIILNEKRARTMCEIERLERQARKEIQPRKKFELVQQVQYLKKELEKYE